MLSDRKKYNYMVNTGQPSSRTRQPSSTSSSAYKPSATPLYQQNENINIDYLDDYQPTESKRIVELENANKKMLQETTKQFQKFQADVVKVQGILRIKEQQVERLESEKRELTEDKAALIDALRQKEAIILQFHDKLKELIEERESRKTFQKTSSPIASQTQTYFPSTTLETESQTDPIEKEAPSAPESSQKQIFLERELSVYKSKYETERAKTETLTEQVYKLKQQVYEVNSELGLIKQQFETHKLLEEIEEVKKM